MATKTKPTPAISAPPPPDASLALVVLTQIDDNPFQPRLSYDAERIAAIAASIAEHDLLQAPVARPAGERIELAFGHSRLRAYQLLAQQDPQRWGAMPVQLRILDDETMALHAWIENKDRKDLTAFEEAKAIERYTSAFGWTQARAAEKLQLDRSTVANKLRLLRLPQQTLDQLQRGELSERQASALLPLMELSVAALGQQLGYSLRVSGLGYIGNANELIAKAANLTSNTLREGVEKILDELTPVISKQSWYSHDWRGVEGIRSPLCKACPALLAGGRCADHACQKRKEGARQQQQAANAAAAAGLPAQSASGHNAYDDLSGVSLAAIKKQAQARGCGKLGVIWLKHGYMPHKVDGHPNCGIVCVHGEGKRCACKAALAKSASPVDSEAARKRHDKKRIKELYKEPAERALVAALAAPSIGLWRLILKRLAYGPESKLAADAPLGAVLEALAATLVKEEIKYEYEYNVRPDDAERKLAKILTAVGVAAPWAPPTPPPAPPPVDPVAAVRSHLAHARELAGVGMAHYYLGEARAALAQVPAVADEYDRLHEEYDQVAALVAEAEAELAGDAAVVDAAVTTAVCTQTPPPDGAERLARWREHAGELRTRIAAGVTSIEEHDELEGGLEWLAGELEDLGNDEMITDADYDAADILLDELSDALTALAVPQ